MRSTLRRINFCRTAALGGHLYRCDGCGTSVPVYNSCTDRHCPTCTGARRASWVEEKEQLLHPRVTYFQAVFTIPERLSSLVLGNRTACYRLLFHAAWKALQTSLAKECGFRPAAAMMLHTWNQRLEHHPHVHALVPGCGPSLDGTRWVECRRTKQRRNKPARPFLVDNKRLGRRFRDAYLAGLRKLVRQQQLRLVDRAAFEPLLNDLQLQDWVVFVQPPPKNDSDPSHVLRYLARYMTGGPISDRRLLRWDGDHITFAARVRDKSGRQEPVTLTAREFIRRWSLHILPAGFMKSRAYGGWSNTQRHDYRALCQSLAPSVVLPDADERSSGAPCEQSSDPPCEKEEPLSGDRQCPHCHARMRVIDVMLRPSWRDLFYGGERPAVVIRRDTG